MWEKPEEFAAHEALLAALEKCNYQKDERDGSIISKTELAEREEREDKEVRAPRASPPFPPLLVYVGVVRGKGRVCVIMGLRSLQRGTLLFAKQCGECPLCCCDGWRVDQHVRSTRHPPPTPLGSGRI